MSILVYYQHRHLSNLDHKQRQMYYPKRMNFWENVEFLLDQKGILKSKLNIKESIMDEISYDDIEDEFKDVVDEEMC